MTLLYPILSDIFQSVFANDPVLKPFESETNLLFDVNNCLSLHLNRCLFSIPHLIV
jgi:hypothetical protein